MEGHNKREVSLLVFGGFIVLFILFLFLGPQESTKGAFTFDGIVGSAELGGISIVTLIIVFVILIVVLIGVILLLKKFRRKSHNFVAPPNPGASPADLGQKNITSPLEENAGRKAESSSGDILDEDIESLFSENVSAKKEEPIKEIPSKKQETSARQENAQIQKPLVNANQLKVQVSSLLGKGYSREQILEFLGKKGFTSEQIVKTIDEMNNDNLRNYISNALKQGFSKEQVARNLLAHGWKPEQISRFIK